MHKNSLVNWPLLDAKLTEVSAIETQSFCALLAFRFRNFSCESRPTEFLTVSNFPFPIIEDALHYFVCHHETQKNLVRVGGGSPASWDATHDRIFANVTSESFLPTFATCRLAGRQSISRMKTQKL